MAKYVANDDVDVLRIRSNVYAFRSNSQKGNPNGTALVGRDGTVLVDTSFSALGATLRGRIASLGGSVRLIINTAWHGDHTAANEHFIPEPIIAARSAARRRLLTQDIFDDGGRPILREAVPRLTFDQPVTFDYNDEEIRAIPMPNGHTDGDLIVYFVRSNVLAVGDYLLMERWPVIDVEKNGASLRGYLENIRWITESFPNDVTVVPGHSAFWPDAFHVATLSDLGDFRSELLASIELVRGYIDAGLPLAEASRRGLPERFARYDLRPRFISQEGWIEKVYEAYAPATGS